MTISPSRAASAVSRSCSSCPTSESSSQRSSGLRRHSSVPSESGSAVDEVECSSVDSAPHRPPQRRVSCLGHDSTLAPTRGFGARSFHTVCELLAMIQSSA